MTADVSHTPRVAGIEPGWQEMADKITKNLVRDASSDKIALMVDKYLAVDEKVFIAQRAKYKPRPKVMEKACRGLWPERKTHNLTCSYVNKNSAYLKLAPLKLEQLSSEPLIQLYHDVLYDSEIAAIQNAAVSEAEANRVKLNVNHRIADMSAMDVPEHSELHVLNFALGQGAATKACRARSTRLATVVFYVCTKIKDYYLIIIKIPSIIINAGE